jgi:uncharacterized protein YndB with AHSA1/START domain
MWTTEDTIMVAYQHTSRTPAPPEVVWRLYSDVASWPRWNAAVARMRLDGPFAAGTTGELTPPGADPLPFRIVAASENEGYTSETDIAETVTLRTTSRLTALPEGGTEVSHHVELVGPAAEFFGQSFGPTLSAGVPRTAEAVAARAAAVEESLL